MKWLSNLYKIVKRILGKMRSRKANLTKFTYCARIHHSGTPPYRVYAIATDIDDARAKFEKLHSGSSFISGIECIGSAEKSADLAS